MTRDDPPRRSSFGQGPAGQKSSGPRAAKPVRLVTAQYLENSALHYLERFASSTANLRNVLMRKVKLSAQAHGTDPEEGARWIDDLLARYVRSGLLNDETYARMRTESLHRRGSSTRAIAQKLASKGIDRDETDKALESLREDVGPDVDLAAALALAKRRRLGVYRLPEARAAHREKDMAALGRAGFGYEIARRIVDAESPDDLLEE
ncbi:regulatory protein RecX [Azospirillum doebereinerae]|uniref:Regulatory protein RecX n=1 Tax=Azospirillum doebereinerae TaxID=92933 RepID=A0A3S0X2J2_9PROT|nr:regulatory protein RecX [Azospirillum doebereinerae]RUQ76025.1 regulatory protein RecX [Azospirillum doebereinerae]